MKKLALVQSVPESQTVPETGLTMPKCFKKVAQRVAWTDLMESADASLRVEENRFVFEMAATLMAKFRSGKAMNATETKELKKHMVSLGLVKDDDAGPKKTKAAAKYFGAS